MGRYRFQPDGAGSVLTTDFHAFIPPENVLMAVYMRLATRPAALWQYTHWGLRK